MSDVINADYQEVGWVVDRLIPDQGITIMSSIPGAYKTWLLLHIAQTVASGEKLFQLFPTKQQNVLMIDEENILPLIQDRAMRLGIPEDSTIQFLSLTGFKVTPDAMKELAAICKRQSIGLVTIDSLVRVHGADENDASKMAQVFNNLRILSAPGITVLITHHNAKGSTEGKSNGYSMRGSSDILAAIDSHIDVKKLGPGQLELKQTKSRLAPELGLLELEVITDDSTFEFKLTRLEETKGDKYQALLDAVFEIVAAEPDINQKGILKILRDSGSRTSPPLLRKTLRSLEALGVISIKNGAANERLYRAREDEAAV